MRKSDALEYYGNDVRALARAVNRSRSTVAEWPDPVPLEHAFVLQELTKKRKPPLRIDFSLYPKVPKELRQ